MTGFYLGTGQECCYDENGEVETCAGSGQDAEFGTGLQPPEPRFLVENEIVLDRLTGLSWTHDANLAEFPLTWKEALNYIRELNRTRRLGYDDWRLPNRRELRSLISYQTRKPALPAGHPFENVFLGWYWSSTTSAVNKDYAWYVHLEGGRMFYGNKRQTYLVWPARGPGYPVLPQTVRGGEFGLGVARPLPRFNILGETVRDEPTGLIWTRDAGLGGRLMDWMSALNFIRNLNAAGFEGRRTWRLPTINELESLVDVRRHHPALPTNHPFRNVLTTYASSTSSGFEPDWCMALHMDKGAVGVGFKKSAGFGVWAASS
ncbi:MAG: DUF1566 domain-containing protein [Pseudomonadota bacterium]